MKAALLSPIKATGNKSQRSAVYYIEISKFHAVLKQRQSPEVNTPKMNEWRYPSSRSSTGRPWVATAILFLLLALVPACQQEPASEAKPTAVGEYTVAPDFTLPDLNGTKVSLSQYRGKVVLLNFWATWCGPCRLEMPTMEKAYRKYKDQGFEVVAVSVDAGPKSAVRQFLQEFGLTFQVLLDPHMEILHQFQSFSLPTSVVIDRRGVIRSRELGYRDWTDQESTKLITELLNERSS